jgi:hypothetical protein
MAVTSDEVVPDCSDTCSHLAGGSGIVVLLLLRVTLSYVVWDVTPYIPVGGHRRFEVKRVSIFKVEVFAVSFLLGSFLNRDNGSSLFFRNMRGPVQDYMASHVNFKVQS